MALSDSYTAQTELVSEKQIKYHLPQVNEWEKEQQQQRWNNKPGMNDLEKKAFQYN